MIKIKRYTKGNFTASYLRRCDWCDEMLDEGIKIDCVNNMNRHISICSHCIPVVKRKMVKSCQEEDTSHQ